MVVAIFVSLGLLVAGVGASLAVVLPRRARRAWEGTLSGKDLFDVENESRKNVLQVVGSMLVVLGLLATVSQFASTQRSTDRTLRLTEQGQITDRFTRAIEALGATDDKGHEQLEVRLGAIYSLGRLYEDAPSVRHQVIDILAGYVRRHSIKRTAEDPSVSADVSAAFWIIEDHAESAVAVNLSGAALDWGEVVHGHLAAPQFFDVQFSHAQFALWLLPSAQFERADLRRANFRSACLVGALLQNSDLQWADFARADLVGASLHGSNVRNASFDGADLRGASLTSVKGLDREQLADAITDSTTKVDPEFKSVLNRRQVGEAPAVAVGSYSPDEAGFRSLMRSCER